MYDIQSKKVNTLIRPDGTKKAYVRLTPALDVVWPQFIYRMKDCFFSLVLILLFAVPGDTFCVLIISTAFSLNQLLHNKVTNPSQFSKI
ncbi:LOW QUALITY PROTEIN: hypothetical protein NC652_002489 [Populus alba x Populus x berolinensis]|nr:LOW QUALITY PROTEIN: hypothetical protein NC652_002489 [Populus alba x Populus x berolinensis]